MAINELLFDDQGNPIDWRILDINPAFLQRSGRLRDDIVGRRLSEIYGDHAPGPFLSRFASVVRTGEPVQFEEYFEPLRAHMLISAFHLGGTRFATVTTDITERKRAEEALQQSLNRFELLTKTAGELLESPEPQKIVESICRKIMAQLDCHVFFNFLVDDEAGRLHLNAWAAIR